jgi:integrase
MGQKLTVKTVDALGAPGSYMDGNGLMLIVRPSGNKSWIMRYQLRGRRRDAGLGRYPEVGLKEARSAAAAMRILIAAGLDPLEVRKAEQETSKKEAQDHLTFADLATDYIESHRAGWKNLKHADQWTNTLKTYAYPVIGTLAPNDVTTAHILAVLNQDNFWLDKPETASRVRNRIELVLDAAKARGLRDGENPARWRGHLDKLLPRRDKVRAVKHHPALPYQEIPAFFELLDGKDMTSKAMQLTILTACRTSEILQATWDEIDLPHKIWTVPASRMKSRKEHRVPLAGPVLTLLSSLQRSKSNTYLFPGQKTGQPLSNMAMLMGLRRMGRGDLTMHGFRSTFRDWAGECTPHARDVCEQALAHSLGNAVEAAYRRSDLLEKRRALMNDWAAYCYSTTPR